MIKKISNQQETIDIFLTWIEKELNKMPEHKQLVTMSVLTQLMKTRVIANKHMMESLQNRFTKMMSAMEEMQDDN